MSGRDSRQADKGEIAVMVRAETLQVGSDRIGTAGCPGRVPGSGQDFYRAALNAGRSSREKGELYAVASNSSSHFTDSDYFTTYI